LRVSPVSPTPLQEMVRLILPRAKRSWISWRTWSSNGLTSLGARIETSQNRWLTERTSAERRWPSRSISAEPYPVMLRIIRTPPQRPGSVSGERRGGQSPQPFAGFLGAAAAHHFPRPPWGKSADLHRASVGWARLPEQVLELLAGVLARARPGLAPEQTFQLRAGVRLTAGARHRLPGLAREREVLAEVPALL